MILSKNKSLIIQVTLHSGEQMLDEKLTKSKSSETGLQRSLYDYEYNVQLLTHLHFIFVQTNKNNAG